MKVVPPCIIQTLSPATHSSNPKFIYISPQILTEVTMKKILKQFEVDYLQILDENGKLDKKHKDLLTPQQLRRIYELMILARTFDEKAINLQRQGRLGTYASLRGEEACQIKKDDLAVPAFREHGVYLELGLPPLMLFQYWGGDERGSKMPPEVNILPVSIPVGSHPIHAVGAAMAYTYQKKKNVALTYFSDGATSEGAFHEAMNFAGVFKAPVVFICQNNQYAISTPRKEQTASLTIAQKAIAYGFEGIQVDGNDVFAVYKATQDAIAKARSGKGPTLIECFTYRLSDHTTSDDASKYRSKEEVESWEKKDPILRLELYLKSTKQADQIFFKSTKEKTEAVITQAVKKYETLAKPTPSEIFDYLFEKPTATLKAQKAEFLKEVK